MNAEIAQKWIADLRSGKYKQGKGQLCDGKAHCCLGVLCEQAAAQETLSDGAPVMRKLINGEVRFDGRGGMLPPRVRLWAGIMECNRDTSGNKTGVFSLRGMYNEGKGDLIHDNDDGKTFAEIADIIEKHWEKM